MNEMLPFLWLQTMRKIIARFTMLYNILMCVFGIGLPQKNSGAKPHFNLHTYYMDFFKSLDFPYKSLSRKRLEILLLFFRSDCLV